MYNHFVLVGKVEEIRTLTETIVLAVSRSFKDGNDTQNTYDYIKVCVGDLENVEKHIHEGLMLGVKGHIEGDGLNIYLVADKIIFMK